MSIEKGRALVAAATAGEWIGYGTDDVAAWTVYGADGWVVAHCPVAGHELKLPEHGHYTFDEAVERADRNTALIAYMRTSYPLAIDVVEAVKAIRDEINHRFAERAQWGRAVTLFAALDAFEADQ